MKIYAYSICKRSETIEFETMIAKSLQIKTYPNYTTYINKKKIFN